MRNSSESELRNSFALGYFLSAINEYIYSTKSDESINCTDEIILNESLDLLLRFNENYFSLFNEEIILFPNLKTCNDISEYFECFFDYVKEKIHKDHPGINEISFYVGGIVANIELTGPCDIDKNKFIEILYYILHTSNSSLSEFNPEDIKRKLFSDDCGERKQARDSILYLIYQDNILSRELDIIVEIKKVIP